MGMEKVRTVVDNWPTKYDEGFTTEEIDAVLNRFSVNKDKFWEALGVHTGTRIKGEIITYHTDVSLGIICVIQDRGPNVFEFD